MPIIRQLPPALVNKIAAGEVIERPASVVKELLENSVDAGSTRVELVVEKGGLELVRVSDNGCGISIEQLPLAIASHATSKLQNADDLFDIHTLGFRGEALASIAEISHFEMKSRARESESGAIMLVRGGEMVEPQPVGSPVGTSISVRHLFFNTPVRRKFLKSAQTEMGHVVEAFTRVALAYPQVHMVLISNDRTLYDLSPTDRWAERIGAFFGDEVAENLIHVDSEIDDIVLRCNISFSTGVALGIARCSMR
jgi:DNA mismatch repair protein MutL